MNKISNLYKKCKLCEKKFRSTKERRKYCSDECFKESVKRRQKTYSTENKEEIRKRRTTCKYCENTFKMEELKERCCKDEECIKERDREKNRLYRKRYYSKHVKRKTKKYKKRDAENNKRYRRSHRNELNKRERARKKEKREWVDDIRKEKRCSKCGEDRWFCLDFHHLDSNGKEITLADAISRGYGKEKILEEMEKCITLCSNCHRHLHYFERNLEGWEPTEEWLNDKDVFNENNYK